MGAGKSSPFLRLGDPNVGAWEGGGTGGLNNGPCAAANDVERVRAIQSGDSLISGLSTGSDAVKELNVLATSRNSCRRWSSS